MAVYVYLLEKKEAKKNEEVVEQEGNEIDVNRMQPQLDADLASKGIVYRLLYSVGQKIEPARVFLISRQV